MKLEICHLYPDVLNLYGDNGNIPCLQQRLAWRGIESSVTRLPIGEIAVLVSYPNQRHFSRAFKNVHGVSPREYRLTHYFEMDGGQKKTASKAENARPGSPDAEQEKLTPYSNP